MKWEQDVYTTNYICPYCGKQVEPTIDEEKMMYV